MQDHRDRFLYPIDEVHQRLGQLPIAGAKPDRVPRDRADRDPYRGRSRAVRLRQDLPVLQQLVHSTNPSLLNALR